MQCHNLSTAVAGGAQVIICIYYLCGHDQFQRSIGERGEDADLWLAYCAFHLGDHKRAMQVWIYNLTLWKPCFCFFFSDNGEPHVCPSLGVQGFNGEARLPSRYMGVFGMHPLLSGFLQRGRRGSQ